MKQVQIPEALFVALVKYHLVGVEEEQPMIQKGLKDKLDAILKRELYSQYKTAPSEEDREKARQAYLEQRGIHKGFRY